MVEGVIAWLIGFLTIFGPVPTPASGVFIAVIVSVIGRLSGFGLGIVPPADFTCVIVAFDKGLAVRVCVPLILGCAVFDVLPCRLVPVAGF